MEDGDVKREWSTELHPQENLQANMNATVTVMSITLLSVSYPHHHHHKYPLLLLLLSSSTHFYHRKRNRFFRFWDKYTARKRVVRRRKVLADVIGKMI